MTSTKEQKSKQTYVLSVGQQGLSRLQLLNHIYNPYSQSFFSKIHTHPESTILSIGCGIGLMDIWLAKQLTGMGKVIATDISEEQLGIAYETALKEGVKNISFQQLDVHELNYQNEFDVIYTRFTLAHLMNSKKIIKKMIEGLKPGGVLWCEDMVNSKIFSIPESHAVKSAVGLVTAIGEKNQFNTDFGEELFETFVQADLENITGAISQPVVSQLDKKSLLLFSIIEAKKRFIAEQIAVEEDLDKIINSLTQFTESETTCLGLTPIVQVSGYKPKDS